MEMLKNKLINNNKANNIVFIIFIISLSVLIFTQQYKLINYLVWEDEFETIVASRMMAEGLVLFKEIFNQHGPLTFLISLLLEIIGFNSFYNYRLTIIIIQIAIFISFAFSPIIKHKFTRLMALIIVASYILLVTPDLYGHTYTYQNLAGLILMFLLSQFIIPQSFYNTKISDFKILIFLILLFSLPFLAVTYIPVTFFLFLLIFEFQKIKIYVTSLAIALSLNALFITATSSWKGYFVYHYYLNATVLSEFYPNQSLGEVPMNLYRSIQPHFIYFTILLVVAGYLLVKINKDNRYKYIILLLAFASLLIRGVDFQALPFYYAIATLLIVVLVKLEQYRTRYISTSILGILCAMFLALFTNQEKISKNQVPQSSDFQQLSDFVTNKNDTVFSYTFKNSEYILADRLPASNDYFYLPAQAEYYKNPILGVENDICEQLKSVAPKVGYFEKYDWSEELKWDVYANCVNELLASEYQNLTFNTLFIRKDLLVKESLPAIQNVESEFRPSRKLKQGNQLEINFPESLKKYPVEIERIGILFATYGKKIPGSFQLEVRDLESQVINYEIDGQDISDNRYTFINLKNHKVDQLSLKSTQDIEISTWESVSDDQSNTCILLKFTNGKFYLTPGCLPF
jgi:hypothetical protein